MSMPIDLSSRDTLIQCVNTALSSKVVSSSSGELAPKAVDAVLRVLEEGAANVDLRDIRVVKKLGGTVDDTELVDGIVFQKCKPSHKSGGPTKVLNAKIALIQFQVATPKTDIENSVIVKDYQAMDRIMKEERKIIAEMVKKIAASGCNVLLIQKSILKDATNDLSLHFLAKKGIMVVQDIEREDVPFISKATGCVPIAHIENMNPDKFGSAQECSELRLADDSKIFRIVGSTSRTNTVSILVRGSNPLVIDQAERSIHDALCVLRCLVKNRAMVPGGSAPQLQISHKVEQFSRRCHKAETIIIKAYAQALEVIPYTLAENAGLNPIAVVTDLRARHAKGEKYAGISVRKGVVSDIGKESVLQPALVTQSALTLATEVVRMILKIDDLVLTMR